jgi:hypothetical protein
VNGKYEMHWSLDISKEKKKYHPFFYFIDMFSMFQYVTCVVLFMFFIFLWRNVACLFRGYERLFDFVPYSVCVCLV